MKKAIRYLRFSSDGQSHHSIERQDAITAQWINHNKIVIVDTFIDEGYTAKNFDRPDIKQLFEFIRKNHRGIDYLVVSELTRFSRETGDAINMVKKIQREYGVRIVSAMRGTIYDCLDHNSFFMMGLEFLLGNSENIKRTNDINGGIYTAKAVKGKWIQGGAAPYGYKKEGTGDHRHLVIHEPEAIVVRYIFQAFLHNTPFYIIEQKVKQMGFNRTGNGRVHEILKHPVYYGYQYVKPYKDLPGGLFQLKNHQPIVDVLTWNAVQEKLNRPDKARVAVAENFPLRGVLHCHCKKLLTGAPSKSRNGNYYGYYKCQSAGHNNYNADEAHKKLNEALGWMSLPSHWAVAIREKTYQVLEERTKDNRLILEQKKAEFDKLERQMESVEKKFIDNQINFDTYNRWHMDISSKRVTLNAEIEKMDRSQEKLHYLLENNLQKLTDLQSVYKAAPLTQGQELLRMVFDNSLYLKDKVYRTTYVMPVFTHNLLILNQKNLLVLDDNETNLVRWRPQYSNRTTEGFLSDNFTDFLSLIDLIRVA
jgi:site-specific DNA recombinase